jgi:hypothetical protein
VITIWIEVIGERESDPVGVVPLQTAAKLLERFYGVIENEI